MTIGMVEREIATAFRHGDVAEYERLLAVLHKVRTETARRKRSSLGIYNSKIKR